MTSSDPEHLPVTESWDTYWHGARANAAYTGRETGHPAVLGFWADYFRDLERRRPAPAIVDVASGSGAVPESASSAFGGLPPGFACIDVSAAAIRMVKQRFPGVHAIVGDARSIPLESGSFDVATSQFGVEYAGIDTVGEVSRLVAPGGEIAFLLHHDEGIIYRDCGANLGAIRELRAAAFFPRCIALFEAGFAALGGGDRERFGAEGRQFTPAVRALESIMRRYGREIADGSIVRIYRDVRHLHSRMHRYDARDVLPWLRKLDGEFEAYAGRMASMRAAAIDERTFAALSGRLAAQGFDVLRAEALRPSADGPPLAWALIARRV